MKDTRHCTNKKRVFKEGSMIIAKTDLNGLITYVNRTFIEMSGYSRKELIGNNFNAVLHPDMPASTFYWIRDDFQKTQPWSAFVKNRSKNGDYYWVHSNFSPFYENGKIKEYVSVHTAPTREEISEAEEKYRDVIAGNAVLELTGVAKFVDKIINIRTTVWQKTAMNSTVLFLALIAVLTYMRFDPLIIQSVLGTGASIVLVLGTLLTRRLEAGLTYTRDKLRQIASGDYFNWAEVSRKDDIGVLIKNIYATQVHLGFDLTDARDQANDGVRIKTALDNVTSNVMMVDDDHLITYCNNSVVNMFKNAESDLTEEIPEFDASSLIETNVNLFKESVNQQKFISDLTKPLKTEVRIGVRTLGIIANPVIAEDGETLGSVLEWNDRTVEVAIEKEVGDIVDSAKAGILTKRIDLEGKQEFFKQLGLGVNEMLDVVTSAFEDINKVMSCMSQGDMTYNITRDFQGVFGDVKDNINQTISQLGVTISDIRQAADEIKVTSQEISEGNNSLSARTESQASALEETAASVEELTAIVKQNADNAQQANHLASSARDTAEKGGNLVSNVVTAMREISQSSNKISEIIGVINEIAFQTNLLALNASVEAARAGDQGRGFAVVATEVRNLAQRSATAAKEIKEHIQESVVKVENGSTLVNASGEALNEIVTGVNKVSKIIAEIAGASKEQSLGINQVNSAVTDMDALTQQNAALAEQTYASSVAMSERAGGMVKSVEFFKLNGSESMAQTNSTLRS